MIYTSVCHASDLTTTKPNSSHISEANPTSPLPANPTSPLPANATSPLPANPTSPLPANPTSPLPANPTSPLLFSDPAFNFDNETPQAPTPSFSHQSSNPGSSHDTNLQNSTIGDVDTDLIEMDLYDLYRKEDGKGYSNEYLHKCRNKLRRKVRIKINELQRQIIELKSESEHEKKRIRMFYETIAFGRSRSGRIVQSALGTSSAAGKIMEHQLYIVLIMTDIISD